MGKPWKHADKQAGMSTESSRRKKVTECKGVGNIHLQDVNVSVANVVA